MSVNTLLCDTLGLADLRLLGALREDAPQEKWDA